MYVTFGVLGRDPLGRREGFDKTASGTFKDSDDLLDTLPERWESSFAGPATATVTGAAADDTGGVGGGCRTRNRRRCEGRHLLVEATLVTEFNIAIRADLNGAVLEAGAHNVDGLGLQCVLITKMRDTQFHTIRLRRVRFGRRENALRSSDRCRRAASNSRSRGRVIASRWEMCRRRE